MYIVDPLGRSCRHSRLHSFSPASEALAGAGSQYAATEAPGTGCAGSGTWIALVQGHEWGLCKYTQLCFSLDSSPSLPSHTLTTHGVFSDDSRRSAASLCCIHVLNHPFRVSPRLKEAQSLLSSTTTTASTSICPLYRSIRARTRCLACLVPTSSS